MLVLIQRPVKTSREAGAHSLSSTGVALTLARVGVSSPSGDDRTGPPTSAVVAVAALADDSRRRMYEFIRGARRPVSREEAAASIGISRKLAAFHLEKLVEVGLLRASSAPIGGSRRVGRTPKVYEPGDEDVRISIPERQPELLAQILLDAVLAEDDGGTVRTTATEIARERGTVLGAAERDRNRGGRFGAERALSVLTGLLARHGFEPGREAATQLRLRNCPFQPLAGRAPEVVCALNHAFISGMVDGLQTASVMPTLIPRSGECCVQLTAAG
jgi:predicted ArsR family transcriptional regulator